MCDQTEVTYSPGDVVWVKLGPVWWPGQVQDYDKLPDEITASLRKKPIAVVKFFQEDTFEYVKNLNQIYQYNCRKKQEFIKKGLDLVRSSNSRDVPSNMKMFPNDIVMAEHLTGGDPNILDHEAFAPEQKSNYSDLFGTKKSSGKKFKGEALKREHDSWKSGKYRNSPMKNGQPSLLALSSTIPRPITHPRFITKALEGWSDHEIRIRCQLSTLKDDQENTSDAKKYKCHLCEFQCARLNVIVLHNKSHSASFIDAQNANRARFKSREREHASPILNSFEQTQTTVTSRGRIKSLPKKLMDYTDEPPPKIFKEKTYNKHANKEEIPESLNKSSSEKSLYKTPKKQKEDSERISIKRPLFGKRKTAKEKAELAAKQKQENEAMKEKLLKDWDDDDVNQEEVELERLKQALESTTTLSIECDDDNITIKDSQVPSDVPDKPVVKIKEKLSSSSSDKKSIAQNDIKTKVFEFDDSEDSLPVNINFRLKSQREKFTDDKFKKPRPPRPLTKVAPKPKLLRTPPPPPPEKKEEDKEAAEFNKAFNALLEETVVPVLPEIPKTSVSIIASSGQISDQTSDISSSTDLIKISDMTVSSDEKNCKDGNKTREDSDYEITNDDSKMECTSSDSEEMKSSDPVILCDLEESKIEQDQKNFKEVSASDPIVEMGADLLSSGVAITTTYDETDPVREIIGMCEDSTATEISSTCDISISYNEASQVKPVVLDEIVIEENLRQTEDTIDFSISDNINVEELNTNIDRLKHECNVSSDFSKTLKMRSTNNIADIEKVQEVFKYSTIEGSPTDQDIAIIISESDINSKDSVEQDHLQTINVPSKHIATHTVKVVNTFNTETEIEKDEFVTQQNEQVEMIKEEIIQQTSKEPEHSISGQFVDNPPQQVAETDNTMNVQLLLPVVAESDINTVQISSQQQQPGETIQTGVANLEIAGSCKTENQNLPQNLQDMELDINSMPVIIGGEDFIQPEQPKQNVVQVQPKYSESIVISPKTSASSPNKTENVIMHLAEPSASNQNLQSVIANKIGRSGGRGVKSQKTTSKTIKLSASALKNLSTLQKGGNQQVLILKTASGQDKQDKGTIQKHKGPLNMFQHGNKILIVNNPQMSGQNKIKLNPQQQQLLTGGKLAPGTRVFTSKVVATTSQGSASTSKTSTSRSSSKSTQKLVISKGGMLSNTSKSVIINNNTGKLMTSVPGTHTITTNKGQTLITHNILNSKSGLILPNPSQSASSSGKTTTIITSQALATSKGMILAPIASKGGTILSGNQKLRIVSSKAPLSGTRLVVQNPQGKLSIDSQHKGQQLKLISGLRGQSSGNAILIQTSQGILAKSIASSTTTTAAVQPTIRKPGVAKTIMSTISTQAKIRITTTSAQQPQIVQHSPTLQQPQLVQQAQPVQRTHFAQQPQVIQPSPSVKKMTVQKIKQSPNILQKTQRKSTPRATKLSGNRLISPVVSTQEPIILSTTSSIPVIAQPTLVQGQVPQSSDGLVYLTVDEAGNYRQVDNKSLITFQGNTSETPRTIFIPADSRPQDVGNIFLAIDDAGNIVNITQPAPSSSFTTESTAPSQDILAKALANTQVLQQETIIPDIDVSTALSSTSMDSTILPSSSFNEQAQYPAPSLSHSVLETSLTLNQPIMTPLEVPSAVSPNLGQISSLSSNYITSNLLTSKQKHLRPSMPLLTEESLANQARGEPVFLLDSSNNIIPATSGSQISFQLTLDENNVIMSSGTGAVLPPTYQVVSNDLLTSQLVASGETQSLPKIESVTSEAVESEVKIKFESGENMTFGILPQGEQISTEAAQTVQHSIILREALEAPQSSLRNEHFLNNVEIPESDPLGNSNPVKEEYVNDKDEQECRGIKIGIVDSYPGQVNESFDRHDSSMLEEEVKHSLKRSLAEDEAVTSSSDLEDAAKRIMIDER